MMETERLILKTPEDTEALGKRLADILKPGSVVALIGPLGAGKTALTQAAARGLGVTERLASPTFTVVQEYRSGRLPLYHFDVYRVNDPDDLFELGFEEYLHGDGACFIEWADLVEDMLPEDTIYIRMDYGGWEEERTCEISGADLPAIEGLQ